MTHLSVVVPVLNESTLIEELITQIKVNSQKITDQFEIIIIDDGSSDQTWNLITKFAMQEKRIKGIKFSRNFGHHYAITAGLQKSTGEWVVVMDGDLQDRPEVIQKLYKKAQEGYDVVFVSRTKRPEAIYYLFTQKLFYWFLSKLSGMDFDNKQANFSIISKKVVAAFNKFPENSRFYVSTIKWLGFKNSFVLAEHGKRFSGRPSYTFRKRIKLAVDVIVAFSERPLRFSIYLGLTVSFLSILGAIFILFKAFTQGFSVVGWSSLIISVFFLGGILLIVLGILGVYIGHIFREVKNRPLFVISENLN
jgi:glycosyltransferase involved in cell wall biosynthesis